jgi:hypothetical protein
MTREFDPELFAAQFIKDMTIELTNYCPDLHWGLHSSACLAEMRNELARRLQIWRAEIISAATKE